MIQGQCADGGGTLSLAFSYSCRVTKYEEPGRNACPARTIICPSGKTVMPAGEDCNQAG
ncbi:MAG: hypothetical protein GXY34_01190 [Syntrophomonadaceae bacterium]|nr:hypothetical protein [Syntrophomonadaceae bacterium]